MGPISIALVLVLTLAASATVAVFAERRHRLGAPVLACGTAVPLSILALSPVLGKAEQPHPVRAAGTDVQCRLMSRAAFNGEPNHSYVAQPDVCRPPRAYEQAERLAPAAIVTSGPSLRIVPNAVKGYVDAAKLVDGRPQLSGWGGNVVRGRAASSVLFFVGRRFQGAVKPTAPRPDVVNTYHRAGLRLAGFRVVLPAPLDDGRALRIFVVDREVASPLRLDCTNPQVKLGC